MSSSYSSAGEESADSELSNDSIYEEYGGMRNFMHSYGLKMYNDDDVEEAKAIATEMRRQDDQEGEPDGADCREPTSEPEPHQQKTLKN